MPNANPLPGLVFGYGKPIQDISSTAIGTLHSLTSFEALSYEGTTDASTPPTDATHHGMAVKLFWDVKELRFNGSIDDGTNSTSFNKVVTVGKSDNYLNGTLDSSTGTTPDRADLLTGETAPSFEFTWRDDTGTDLIRLFVSINTVAGAYRDGVLQPYIDLRTLSARPSTKDIQERAGGAVTGSTILGETIECEEVGSGSSTTLTLAITAETLWGDSDW